MNQASRYSVLFFCTAILGGTTMFAWAQAYPIRPVRLVLPGPAAGGVDVITRPIARALSDSAGQQFVVDNRPGASGLIAGEMVARAVPDGYTALVGTSGTHSIGPLRAKNPPYDPVRDFAPVALLATAPLMVAVHPSFPARSIQELIRIAKSRPGQISYASNGPGTIQHLTTEMLCQEGGFSMLHVPYKGGTPAVIDVVSGQVQLVITALPTVLAQVRAARLRGIAVTGAKRSPSALEFPTVSESGMSRFVSEQWFAIFLPVGVPHFVKDRLSGELRRAVRASDVSAALSASGAEIVASGPAELQEFHRADITKWQRIISRSGLSRE